MAIVDMEGKFLLNFLLMSRLLGRPRKEGRKENSSGKKFRMGSIRGKMLVFGFLFLVHESVQPSREICLYSI